MTTADTTLLTVEELTPAAFRPFGEVIGVRDDLPADFSSESGKQEWLVDFRSGVPLITVVRTPYQGRTFTKMESHAQVTQTFLPLGGSPAVIAVGPAEPGSADPPRPDQVRAFLLDGGCGIRLDLGVWHSMDRMPVGRAHTTWVMVSDHETQLDLFGPTPEGPRLTRIVDYGVTFGTTFHLALRTPGQARA